MPDRNAVGRFALKATTEIEKRNTAPDVASCEVKYPVVLLAVADTGSTDKSESARLIETCTELHKRNNGRVFDICLVVVDDAATDAALCPYWNVARKVKALKPEIWWTDGATRLFARQADGLLKGKARSILVVLGAESSPKWLEPGATKLLSHGHFYNVTVVAACTERVARVSGGVASCADVVLAV